MNTVRRLLLLVSIFLAGFPALFAQTETIELLPLPERENMTEIIAEIKELDSLCPIQLDDVTTISNVTLCDSMMVYTVEYAGAEDEFLQLIPLKGDLHDLFLSTDADNTDPLAINLATHDVGIKYHFKRLSGSEEFDVIITSQELRDAINISLKDEFFPFEGTVELLPLPERDDLKEIINEIKELDSLCPVQVDDVTFISNVTFYDRTMAIFYEIAAKRNAFLQIMSATQGLHDMLLSSYIEDLDSLTINLASHDVGIKFHYKRMYGEEKFAIDISAQELRDAINSYLEDGTLPYEETSELQSFVDVMKTSLPIKVDSVSYIVDIEYRDKVLSYRYETNGIDDFKVNSLPENEQTVKENYLNSFLRNSDFAKALLEEEALLKFIFRDRITADSVVRIIEAKEIKAYYQRIEDHSEALRLVEEVNKNLPLDMGFGEFEGCELNESQNVVRFIFNVDEMIISRLEGQEEINKLSLLATLFAQLPSSEWSRIYVLGISMEYVFIGRMTKRTVTIPITREEIHEMLFSN